MTQRLARRHFPPLAQAPTIQGRLGELGRLLRRAVAGEDERLSYQANDWLMATMQRECGRPAVRAVHSYEDCSLGPFEHAKRLGKACIYDMPIGYHAVWRAMRARLIERYADWLGGRNDVSDSLARPDQKEREMLLADLVLAPSSFAARTILERFPNKRVELAPYAVDAEFWSPAPLKAPRGPLRLICAGQLSIRKGTPELLEAWSAAALPDATLELVGPWQLDPRRLDSLPPGVQWQPACGPVELRERYRSADAFIFPSRFEGFGLVLLEAMACGLPVLASDATAGPDVIRPDFGLVTKAGDFEELVAGLRWIHENRDGLAEMGKRSRRAAEALTWRNYRAAVTRAVERFL